MDEEKFLNEIPKVWITANEQFDYILGEIVQMAKLKVKDKRNLPNRKEMITLIDSMARIFYNLTKTFSRGLLKAMRVNSLPSSPPSDRSPTKKKKEWNSMIAFLNANIGPISKYVVGSPLLGKRMRRLALDAGALLEFLKDDFEDSNVKKNAPMKYKLAKTDLDMMWSSHGVKIQAYVNEIEFIFQENEDTELSPQALLKATKDLYNACEFAWKQEGGK